LKRKGHAEAGCVCGGQKLLGVRAPLVTEPGAERIRPRERPALAAVRTVSTLQRALPGCFGVACRHRCPPFGCARDYETAARGLCPRARENNTRQSMSRAAPRHPRAVSILLPSARRTFPIGRGAGAG